jgi:hypothetical protein
VTAWDRDDLEAAYEDETAPEADEDGYHLTPEGQAWKQYQYSGEARNDYERGVFPGWDADAEEDRTRGEIEDEAERSSTDPGYLTPAEAEAAERNATIERRAEAAHAQSDWAEWDREAGQ